MLKKKIKKKSHFKFGSGKSAGRKSYFTTGEPPASSVTLIRWQFGCSWKEERKEDTKEE